MHRFSIAIDQCPSGLRPALAGIMAERPDRFGPGGIAIRFIHEPAPARRLAVTVTPDAVEVRHATPTDAFRALGRLLGVDAAKKPTAFTETARFKVLGAFIDASRNGVLRVDQAKALMRRFALMGLNQVIIYTEDTYEVPGEPFFGYLRGGYSQSELKDLDDHAHDLGLEMQLCIQVLGHLEQLLQWPTYAANRDTAGILLAEDDATYALIEKMVVAATSSLRCKTLQIGMDEAHGLGSGRYKKLHGAVPPFDILNRHLTRVREICRTHGIKPRIMSDMYFRLGSKADHYYDTDCVIPSEVIKDIPKDVGLTYWDYYHTSPDFYENWIDRHRALGSEPIMWTGVWTWCRMWAGLPFSLSAIDACMTASKKKKLPEVAACMWGDDGTECDIYSALPGLQFFAEHGHAEQVDPLLVRANFRGTCQGDFDDWVRASDIDVVPGYKGGPAPKFEFGMETAPNIGKWLLWQDPALSFFDPQLGGRSPRSHFERLARELDAAAAKDPHATRLDFPAQIARVLALKCDLRTHLASAYRAGDKKRIAEDAKGDLAALRVEVDKLWKLHRARWLSLYRPFGLEVIDLRYGGLRTRLETLHDRIADWVAGRVETLPELGAELRKIWEVRLDNLPEMMHLYHRLKSPSMMK